MTMRPVVSSSRSELVEIEAGALEGPAEADVALVHHVDDGRDQLRFRASVLGDRAHEIEERDVVVCHCRSPWSQLRCQEDRTVRSRVRELRAESLTLPY